MIKKSKSIARLITQFSQAEIDALFKSAKTIVKKPGIEIRRAKKTGDFGKVLIVIPAAAGTAVERNLLRRRLKALFYQNKLYENGFDLIVLAKKSSASYTFDELTQLLNEAVQ